MSKLPLSKKPQTSPLRKMAMPLLATALATSATGCVLDVGVPPSPESAPDAGQDDAGQAEPEFVGEPPAEPAVGVPPEAEDGGEPGIDG